MSTAPVRYFGGTSAMTTSKVSLLRATNFKDLVESYLFVPVAIPMTRHDFLAHPNHNKLKDGPFIMAASFPWDEGNRSTEAADAMNLAIIDIDGGKEAKDFFLCPEAIREALHPYSFCAWTTARHTPENPRLKIVVPVKTCDPTFYHRIVRMLLRRLGLPPNYKGITETLILVQPQFRPVVFLNEPFLAVIASHLTGQEVNELDAPEIPDEEVTGERTFAYEGDEASDSLAFLPDFGLTVEDISEPLFATDANCGYGQWWETACALRHNFPREDEAREAFRKWNEWSATGDDYPGEEACYRKWKSFSPYPKNRKPIRIGTLYHYAQLAGWVNTKLAAKVKTHVLDWINSATDVDMLIREGPRKIAEMPFKSELEEEVIADKLLKAIKLLGMTVSKTTLMKEVRGARFADRTESVREENPAWMLPFCFIGPDNLFRNVVTGSTYNPEAFNNTFSRYLVAPVNPDSDDVNSARPLVLPSHKALNEAKIKVVDATIYDPRKNGAESFFESKGKWFVNTYLKSSIPQEEPEYADVAGRLFRKLLKVNLGNDLYESIFLDWFAFVVQNPGVLIRWAIFLQGAQGCGKGTLGDCLASAIGESNYKVISASAMASDFNDWRAGSRVVYVDEIKSPGKNRHEIANKLKDCISNTVIPVNQKFKDVTNIPNVTNYILTTNNIDALALEDSDRRYFVLISLIQFRDQVLELMDTGLIQKIHKLIEAHPGAFRSYFLSHEVSKDFALNGPAPETVYRQQLIHESKNRLQVMLEEIILEGDNPLIQSDVIAYSEADDLTRIEQRNAASLTHYLRTLGYSVYQEGRKFDIDGRKTAIWTHDRYYFPEIEDADVLLRDRVAAQGDRPL